MSVKCFTGFEVAQCLRLIFVLCVIGLSYFPSLFLEVSDFSESLTSLPLELMQQFVSPFVLKHCSPGWPLSHNKFLVCFPSAENTGLGPHTLLSCRNFEIKLKIHAQD